VVHAHLGGGASVCAVNSEVSQWCSMGFTPLEGVPIMTRSGSVDPGMLLWLQTSAGLTADESSDGLGHASGLFGLSGGLSGDTRILVAAAADGNRQVEPALAVYTLRVRQEIAAAARASPGSMPWCSPARSAPINPRFASRWCPGSPCWASPGN
jgi:acetate kinase